MPPITTCSHHGLWFGAFSERTVGANCRTSVHTSRRVGRSILRSSPPSEGFGFGGMATAPRRPRPLCTSQGEKSSWEAHSDAHLVAAARPKVIGHGLLRFHVLKVSRVALRRYSGKLPASAAPRISLPVRHTIRCSCRDNRIVSRHVVSANPDHETRKAIVHRDTGFCIFPSTGYKTSGLPVR